MSKDIEEADPHVPQNPSKGFFYSRTPMLLVDARGRVGDVNAALRVLMGKDLAGCEGQGHEFLSARLGSRLDGELFPADGVARTCATVAGSRKRPMYDEIRVAETLCRYRSPEFGLADLSADEVPCIGTATGVLLGSVLNVAVLRLEGAAAYQAALRKRWTHEILWAIYASSYDAIILKLPFYQEVLDRHLAAMRRRDIARVVDIGAGTGTVTVALVKEGKSVTAVDVCRAMLEKFYSKLGGGSARNLTVIEDTAECLPQLADASFDGVTALNSFFDMEDPYAALGEAVRVLRPGGTIVITDPKACFDAERLKAFAERYLIERELYDSLRDDWLRVQSVTPALAETIASKRVPDRRSSPRPPWHAEATYETLSKLGFVNLSFEDAHMGNCATIRGMKPS
ncbi:MAG: methyltransferase domain-containing protein [Isosphaeraceae bacterium]